MLSCQPHSPAPVTKHIMTCGQQRATKTPDLVHTRAQWTASQKPVRAISPEHKPIPMHGEALHVTQHSEILKQRIQKGKALSNSST